jgi:restriction system protein
MQVKSVTSRRTPSTPLSISELKIAASSFLESISDVPISHLYGVTDGKAVGTHVEHEFHKYLSEGYSYNAGSSASGIDFPEIGVDLKVTSLKQPQSSCPFRDAGQKVYGLGYHLLVFVYDKADDEKNRTARLKFQHAVFVSSDRTGDYQTTQGIRDILQRGGNKDDVLAFLEERNLPLGEIGRNTLADEIMRKTPNLGFLTISNALQWRLQYGRVISVAGTQDGVEKLIG